VHIWCTNLAEADVYRALRNALWCTFGAQTVHQEGTCELLGKFRTVELLNLTG
jgi:hypothetical protein